MLMNVEHSICIQLTLSLLKLGRWGSVELKCIMYCQYSPVPSRATSTSTTYIHLSCGGMLFHGYHLIYSSSVAVIYTKPLRVCYRSIFIVQPRHSKLLARSKTLAPSENEYIPLNDSRHFHVILLSSGFRFQYQNVNQLPFELSSHNHYRRSCHWWSVSWIAFISSIWFIWPLQIPSIYVSVLASIRRPQPGCLHWRNLKSIRDKGISGLIT